MEKFDSSPQVAGGIDRCSNISMASYTTFQLGGPAQKVITVSTPDDLLQCIQKALVCDELFLVIGGGSNIVCSDVGLPCTVLRYLHEQAEIMADGDLYMVPGSAVLDQVVAWGVAHGLAGLTFASGIPGTIGGAVAGNAGAFGAQIGDCIVRVEVIDPQTGQVSFCSQDEMKFDYRTSYIRETGNIISRVWLQLMRGDADNLHQKRQDILNLRRKKHPDWRQQPCAGSIFRNLEPLHPGDRRMAAGKLLDEAGAHDMRVGGAAVFAEHANIIVKEKDSCTARDVFDLLWMMHDAVLEQTGIALIPEIHFMGPFPGPVSGGAV